MRTAIGRSSRWLSSAWQRPWLRLMVGIGTASVVVPTSAVLTRACMLSLPSELEPSESTSQPPQNSLRVVSRNGEPLAHLRTGDGKRHVQLPLADFGDKLPAALIAAEDRR